MANAKQTKIRKARRKFNYPLSMTSFDADLNIQDGRYRSYPTELDSSSVDSQGPDVQQHPLYENSSTLEYFSSGPHEHIMLSDHIPSIDVLILDREMKTVLTDLEKLGILEDDYRSLAMTAGEEEKVDDHITSIFTAPLAPRSEEMETEDRNTISVTTERENEWEVISSAGSVWTVETFEEEKSFRDAVLYGSPSISTCASAHFNGEPRIHTIPVEMMPPICKKPQQPKQLVNLEMLERADLWSSIRDSIRGIGARQMRG